MKETEQELPPAIERGQILIRGTAAWDARELARKAAGCSCLGFGSIEASIHTNGRTAQHPPVGSSTA